MSLFQRILSIERQRDPQVGHLSGLAERLAWFKNGCEGPGPAVIVHHEPPGLAARIAAARARITEDFDAPTPDR